MPVGDRAASTHTAVAVDVPSVTDSNPAATESTDWNREPADEADGRGGSPGRVSRRDALGLGLVGGAVATVVMTAFRIPITDSLPPTAEFWARFVGNGEPTDYPLVALVLHLCYGMGAGAAFGAVFVPRTSGSDAREEWQGTALATGYAMLLSVFGTRVMLERVLGLDLDPDERWIFHVSHAIYGLTLGAWLGSNVPDR
ncbi:hypothetical protein [Halorientalis sp. IM1011]|uniref:hypothetical protein n=1 Tax=Halorientalis sp. IM1011 TaxID=1932360 RepID=UPI0020A3D752|nr:hypothetical protein [Halorientalis sp. IM1011]